MSGETEKFVSGWTTDTLKELVDAKIDAVEETLKAAIGVAAERDIRYSQRFNAQQEALTAALSAAKEAVAAALLAADRAVTKAELASEKRFESVNEFRAALGDQAALMLSRHEYNAAHQALVDKIDRQEKWQSAQSGRDTQRVEQRGQGNADRYVIVTLIAALAGVAATFIATHH